MMRPTHVTIDINAVRHNLSVVRHCAPGVAVCPVVKADAYGHGAVVVAKVLEDAGADWLGVALVEEGIELRQAGIKVPIIVFFGGGTDGAATAEVYRKIVQHKLTPALWRPDQIATYAQTTSASLTFHLKVDTGMSRLGVQPGHLGPVLDVAARYPHLCLSGVMSHFANADLADGVFNRHQVALFDSVVQAVRARGFKPRWEHLSNSAAVLTLAEAHRNLVRPGLMIYGLSSSDSLVGGLNLRPVMSWRTRIIDIHSIEAGTRVSYGGCWVAKRPTVIATLPVGYADGYHRALWRSGEVLIGGSRASVVGVICMDLMMVDITLLQGVAVGDEVVLMGEQGDERITAHDLARWGQTIAYEIICGIGKRVPRHYEGL